VKNSLLDEIDSGEESNPNNIDKVPVIRNYDGGCRLVLRKATSLCNTYEHDKEGDQTAGDV
jgi:hypothetical protein